MKKTVKITQKQLQSIISEEAIKYKKVLELQKRREGIVKQLNEMYDENCTTEEGTVDEGLFGPSKETVANEERVRALANQWATKYANSKLVGTVDDVMAKAKADGYKGSVTVRKSATGNLVLIYVPAAPSTLAQMGAGAAGSVRTDRA